MQGYMIPTIETEAVEGLALSSSWVCLPDAFCGGLGYVKGLFLWVKCRWYMDVRPKSQTVLLPVPVFHSF